MDSKKKWWNLGENHWTFHNINVAPVTFIVAEAQGVYRNNNSRHNEHRTTQDFKDKG